MLLLSRVLATVEGGGEGSRGIATVRLGGDCAVAIDVAMLLRSRAVPTMVDGGGEGSRGMATVRLGGDAGAGGGREASISDTATDNS
jgi:hypothetical protein